MRPSLAFTELIAQVYVRPMAVMQNICCLHNGPELEYFSRKGARKCSSQCRSWNSSPNASGVEAALHGHAHQIEIALDQIGSANEIALHFLAGLARQEDPLRFRLHPFSDDRDTQRVREAEDCADDLGRLRRRLEIG